MGCLVCYLPADHSSVCLYRFKFDRDGGILNHLDDMMCAFDEVSFGIIVSTAGSRDCDGGIGVIDEIPGYFQHHGL